MVQPTNDYLQDCLRIDDFDINAEFIRLPADLAFWNAQYAEAYRVWNTAKLFTEQLVATLGVAIRHQLEAQANGSRVLVDTVNNAVIASQEYRDAKQAEIDAEAEKLRLYGTVDALRAKRDMLVNLGAQLRLEMQNDPLIRQNSYLEAEARRARNGL